MENHYEPVDKFERLRTQAEKLIASQPDVSADPSMNILDLIHDLRIYQAELEIQNQELMRAEQEIFQLQQEYENLYEFAPCGYLTLNPKGVIRRINLTGVRLLGEPKNHLFHTGLTQYIDTNSESAYLSAKLKCAETGEKQTIELLLKRETEKKVWVRADISADRDDDLAVSQWRVVLTDITDKKITEEALARSEARYEKILESMTDPMYVCSPDFTIEYMNPAMITRIGRDATGDMCYLALHGQERPCKWCRFENTRNGEISENDVESPLDGRTYRITNMPVVNDDKTISKLTMYRDITDHLKAVADKQRAQARLQQAQKMESIGNLAGGIAHDFNNILASIIGFTELSLDDVDPGSHLEDNLQEIFSASSRAKELVQQILKFARQTNEVIKPIQIKKVIQETLKLLQSSFPQHVEIRAQLESGALVLGNASLLQQMVMNLATNALHAMEEKGGLLEITTRDALIDDRFIKVHNQIKPGDYILIKVSDTGHGIPPEILKNIFDPYFTTKDIGKGTGMGLALVHGTIRKYGGTIIVESILEQGTTFSIYLPKTERRSEPRSLISGELPHGTERILLVDDELPIAKMGQQLLQRLGYSVTKRTSSVEALELFKTKPNEFDLVVTDMSMPNLSGDKLSIKLLKIRPDIPIILCTGYSKKINDETAAEIGIKGFIYKPVVKDEFAKTVRNVLDRIKHDRGS